jgi:hypothetical protein
MKCLFIVAVSSLTTQAKNTVSVIFVLKWQPLKRKVKLQNTIILSDQIFRKSKYQFRCILNSLRFRPKVVKEVIKQVLHEKLEGVAYHSENTSQWTREIADEIKARLKGTTSVTLVDILRNRIGSLQICSSSSNWRATWWRNKVIIDLDCGTMLITSEWRVDASGIVIQTTMQVKYFLM